MAPPFASPTPASSPSSESPPPGSIAAWRIFLRFIGALLAVVIFTYWAAAGANTGFTKDKIALKKTDEVTGIEFVEYQDHFLPGIEFLAAGTGLGLALIAITFFRKKTKHTS
ncbi:hypothetical protein CMV30_03545 [Nibricoccus aquaticus]|uniref:Uncharacterized protein n=1 Tax=Nibricoccus aquaticus TaxID=2576891 RepID=A0A290Q3V2_9BACT|nr:hypothetical protein [Nibricoccus aquaticus]ATC63103.1 hypothetical protein CMV30_03545 [Nibricoccus aquaticus]